jgi:hypothetical protein
MQLLKLSTAATVVVGPVLDADGAAVTTATVTDFSIAKNGTVAALTTETVTHSVNGYYTIALTTTNTNTLGRLDIITNDSAMSMANHRYNVLPADTYEELLTTGIADAVWDEDNRDHLLAHSTGKNLDTVRKANYVTDGTVAAGGTPTTTTFRTTLTQPDDTYDHQTLLFLTGNLEGESKPILSYSQTNGEITLDEALTEAPVAGNEFVILPQHVHPLSIMVSRIFANEVESGGYTLTRTLQAVGSMLAGLVSGAGSGTESFKAIGNSAKTRVQFIVDDDGNRTGVTYDWS